MRPPADRTCAIREGPHMWGLVVGTCAGHHLGSASKPRPGGVIMHARAVRPSVARVLRLLGPALAVGLVLAATAVAAKPKHGARFSGFSSAPPVVGFKAPVTFKVAANGLSLSNF